MAYEESQMKPANEWYEKLGFTNIRRCSWDSEEGKNLQKDDIDLRANWLGNTVYISEKFRSKDYGDIMVELEDKFDGSLRFSGWLFKSHADYIFYHTPKAIYIIETQYLIDFVRPIYGEQFEFFKDKILLCNTWRPGADHKYQDIKVKHIPTYILGEMQWVGLQMIIPLKYLSNIKIIHK